MRNFDHYILQHFVSVYNIPTAIYQELEKGESLVHWPDRAGEFFKRRESSPSFEWIRYSGRLIPFLFTKDNILWNESEGRIHLMFDWSASCFFFLSGYQNALHTENARMPSSKYWQVQKGVQRLPLVNIYFEVMKEALEKAYRVRISKKSEGPSLFLSHDIDNLNSGWLQGGFSEFRSGRYLQVFKLLIARLKGKDVWNNLDEIIELESMYDCKSTFFMLARQSEENADYDIERKGACHWPAYIESNLNEVGVHGSVGSHVSVDALKEDMDRIGGSVEGNRFHYLNFEFQKTINVIESSGLRYDASTGFFDQVGYAHGYCYPFALWNFSENRPCSFIELPLMAMDTTLEKPKYLGIEPEKANKLLLEVLEESARYNGMTSILWHNNYFSRYKYGGWRNVYVNLIEDSKRLNYASRTGKELASAFQDLIHRS